MSVAATILLLLGLLAAAATLSGPARLRPHAALAALILAPALIAVENWDTARFVDARDEPVVLLGAALVALAAVALLAAGFRRWPAAFALAAVATLPIRVPVEVGGETAHLLLPLYAVIGAGLLARAASLSDPPAGESWRRLRLALSAVLVIYGIQALYGPGFDLAAENAGFFFIPFAVLAALLAGCEWDRRLLSVALLVIVAEAIVFTAVAVGQYAAGELWWNKKVIEGNQYHEWFRVNSMFWDPNIFGRYQAVAVTLLAAVLATASKPRLAWATAIAAVAIIVGLAASFSQSSMLALLAGLAVVVAARWGVRRTAVGLLASGAIIVAALAISGAPDLSEERLEEETSGRVSLIRGGIELAEDAPVAGHGSGSFAPEFRSRFDGSNNLAVSSHSEPITIAAEQGVIGLIPYAALLLTALLALGAGLFTPAPGSGWSPRASLLAVFVVMASHSVAYAAFLTDPITWAVLGVGMALGGAARHASPPGEASG